MAIADTAGLSKLQQIGLALSQFGDAANQFRGQNSNYASQNLQQLQALQKQLLFQQELKKKQARESAQAEVMGGYDPNATAADGTNITWNSGRQVSGIVHEDMPEQGPLPAGMAESERPMVPGIAFNPEMAAEGRAGSIESLRKAFPEQFAEAQVKSMFRDPKDNFLAYRGGVLDISDPKNPRQVASGAENVEDLVNVLDRTRPNDLPRGMSKKSAAALMASNPDRYAIAGATTSRQEETWGNPVAEQGPDGKPIQVRYSNLGNRDVVDSAVPARQGNRFDREDYWRGQFKPYLDSATNANVQASKVRSQLALNTGTGQIAAINAVQKMIDEGAVVRDQDVALIQSAQSLMSRLGAQTEALKSGKLLSPELQNELQGVADALEQATYAGVKTKVEPYSEQLKVEGVSLDSIVPGALRKKYGWDAATQTEAPTGRPRATNAAGKTIEWDGSNWVPVN